MRTVKHNAFQFFTIVSCTNNLGNLFKDQAWHNDSVYINSDNPGNPKDIFNNFEKSEYTKHNVKIVMKDTLIRDLKDISFISNMKEVKNLVLLIM